MPDASDDFGRALGVMYGESVPPLSVPFGLDLCGFVTWLFTGVVVGGIAVAAGFAFTNNHDDNFRREQFEEQYEIPDFDFTPFNYERTEDLDPERAS